MSKLPKILSYHSRSDLAVNTGIALRGITDEYIDGQEELAKEYQAKEAALVKTMRAKQTEHFLTLQKELEIPDEDFGDGSDWAIVVSYIDQGDMYAVHRSEADAFHARLNEGQEDDCQCPGCRIRRGQEPFALEVVEPERLN